MSEVKLPEGYKQTEIGVIPQDWDALEMRELTTLMTNGFVGVAKTHYTVSSDGVLYIQGYNVKENSFNFHGIKRVTPSFHIKNSKSCLKTGDVLMVQTGDVGMTTVVPPELENSNCHALIINRFKNKLNPTYFSYYFNSIQGRARLKEIEVGTTMKHINVGSLLSFIVPVPPKPEQTAIATALSDVDNLIQSLEKLIAKKEAIKTGTMQQLLTGKTRLPEFATRDDGSPKGLKQTELGRIPEDWEVSTLGDIANFLKGSGLPKSDLVDDGQYKCIHYGQLFTLYEELISKVKSSTNIDGNIKSISNDVLMPTSDVTPNGLATASCILEKDVVLGGDILIIRANPQILNGVYFAYLINIYREQVMRLVTGSTVYHLYGNTMSKLTINLPNAKEQTAIATILSDMDKEIQALQQRLEKTRDIKQGMMQQLLTGKVRLAH